MRFGIPFLAVVLAATALASEVSYGQDVKETPEGGYEGAAKITRFIQVKGRFTKDGFVISAIKAGGPGTRLTAADEKNVPPGATNGATNHLDPADVIVEVDGLKIQSQADYATAMNRAKNAQRIEMKIRDCNTGNIYPWLLPSVDSPFIK